MNRCHYLIVYFVVIPLFPTGPKKVQKVAKNMKIIHIFCHTHVSTSETNISLIGLMSNV